MDCHICKQTKVKNKDLFECDGCDESVCTKCSRISATEVRVLQLSGPRILKFYCRKCLCGESMILFQKLVESKEALIEDKITIINLLKEEIEQLKKLHQYDSKREQFGYSAAVKKQKDEILIVKPNDANQTSEKTKKNIEERINPCNLGMGVSKMKYIRDGGVAIKYNRGEKENVREVIHTIKESMGGNYEVKIPEKRNPRIMVFGVSEAELTEKDDMINKIIVQNTINTEENIRNIELIHASKNQKGTNNIIIQLDSKSYECIRKKEKIHIGWRSHFYKDSLNVKQCYNCWRYGHIAKDCKKESPTCQKCSGQHTDKECQTDEECCVNCKHAAEVLKIPNVNYKHKAYDRNNCETYKRVAEQVQEKINYPEIYSKNNKA